MQLKATLIDTTNEGFQYLIEQEGGLEIGMQAWFYLPFNNPFRTSDLRKVEYGPIEDNKFKITCTTRNSVYVFEVSL